MENNYKRIIPVLSDKIEFNQLNTKEFVLSNTFHKHYIKINKETYDLLLLIDGRRSLKKICLVYNLKFNKNISENDLNKLLFERLVVYGVLKGYESKINVHTPPPYLKLSFMIINETFLSKIVKIFYFLFNLKTAILLIFLSIVVIFILPMSNFDLYKSFDLQESIIYFVVIMIFSATFHEIGHATSASYFGAKPGGIGGGFYIFSPVYFSDVTDIWRLKKKQRIIVNLSGMYFELIFCSFLATLGYIINDYVLMTISISICTYTLFNLNPFLRSDGYWILSDLIDKPNLFYHANEKVKDAFRMLRGEKVEWNKIDFVLLIYGLLSAFIISAFLYYILIKNPNSIILFPKNLFEFLKNIFNNNSEISLVKYGELVMPLFFFFLSFKFIKSILSKKFRKQ